MKLSGSYTVTAESQRVYNLLQDPAVLAECMPGCRELTRTGDNEYAMKMSLVISSISGLFDGKVRISDPHPPESFRLLVDGTGKVGFVKGDGLLTLAPNGETTEIRYDGEVQTGGVIASVGQRLLDTTARMLIKRFFDKFSEAARSTGGARPGAAAQ